MKEPQSQNSNCQPDDPTTKKEQQAHIRKPFREAHLRIYGNIRTLTQASNLHLTTEDLVGAMHVKSIA